MQAERVLGNILQQCKINGPAAAGGGIFYPVMRAFWQIVHLVRAGVQNCAVGKIDIFGSGGKQYLYSLSCGVRNPNRFSQNCLILKKI